MFVLLEFILVKQSLLFACGSDFEITGTIARSYSPSNNVGFLNRAISSSWTIRFCIDPIRVDQSTHECTDSLASNIGFSLVLVHKKVVNERSPWQRDDCRSISKQ